MASSPNENPTADDRPDPSPNPDSRSTAGPTGASGRSGTSGHERPTADPTSEGDRSRTGAPHETSGPGTDSRHVEPVEEVAGSRRGPVLWIALVVGAIVLVLLLIFVIQNQGAASFEYFAARFDLPLGVAMLLAAVAGALIMALVGSVRMIQMSLTMRKMRKQLEKIQQSLGR